MSRKLTKEDIINREQDLLNGEYEFIGEYKGSKVKTLFKHNTCEYEWMTTPDNFQRGTRCPRCAGSERLTKESFCEREECIQSGEYQILGKYINTKTKTLFKHTSCGYEWNVVPNSFHAGHRCPKCANQKNGLLKRLTKEEFINREPDLLSGRYSILGEYITTDTKTLFKHNTCGYTWEIFPNNFYRGTRCPKCTSKRVASKQSLSKEEFINREPDLLNGEYEFVGEYINSQTKTLLKHKTCGYEWVIRPNSFNAGVRCPKCAFKRVSSKKLLSKEEFINREPDLLNGEYEFVEEYTNVSTKVLLKHNICGYEWKIAPHSFHAGVRCPKCNQSKGEKYIGNMLNLLNIPFESQKRFNTCRYKRILPFDFYVNDSFLVEYDGEQHFREVDYFGGNKNYKLGQIRDNIKTQWAKDNGIPLVRIPYTKFDDIEQIIKESIEKYCIKKVG